MRLKYTASDDVQKVIAGLGRTEDVKFSPDNSRLAVACFTKNQIAIFDVCITGGAGERIITITDASEISSPYLKCPHGIDFIDENRIIVANREGDVTIFELPPRERGVHSYQLDPIGILGKDDFICGPGAISVFRNHKETYEVLICNNYADRVTKHLIDIGSNCTLRNNEILLNKWLDFPDGICVSEKWIAISNHGLRNVLLYDSVPALNKRSDPAGILSCIYRPHGIRFTSDGHFLLVADYEGNYVHIYLKDDTGWRGVRSPFKSIRVLADEVFLRGCSDGAKGLDIDSSSTIFVTTCKVEPLVFFDFVAIVEESEKQRTSQLEYELKYELDRIIDAKRLTNTLSWRITAPLRWVRASLTPIWPHRDNPPARVA